MNKKVKSLCSHYSRIIFFEGFTLAEVLITLGIIGVVMALTLPVLINKYRVMVLHNQFKSAYSLISQAVMNMGLDNPDLNSYYCNNRLDHTENVFIKDFAKNFQVVKADFTSQNNLKNLGYSQPQFYQTSPGKINFNSDSHNNGAIFLKNGVMIASSGCWWDYGRIDFIVDVNGIKSPNRVGYDVFYFQIGSDNKLYPSAGNMNLQGSSEEKMVRCCNFQESGTCILDTGSSCSLYAIRDVYPHDKSKGYWDSLRL